MSKDVLETYEINGVYKTENDLSLVDKSIVVSKRALSSTYSFLNTNRLSIAITAVMAIKVYMSYKTADTTY